MLTRKISQLYFEKEQLQKQSWDLQVHSVHWRHGKRQQSQALLPHRLSPLFFRGPF